MPKNIHLTPDEEIISVVDKLNQTPETEISLIVPQEARIWQSAVNLKLLKREADNSGKQVTFIVSNDLNAEMAQRTGFFVRKEDKLPIELVQEEDEGTAEENDMEPPVDSEEDIADQDAALEEEEDEAEGQEAFPSPSKLTASVPEAEDPSVENRDMIDYLIKELQPDRTPGPSFASLRKKKKKKNFLAVFKPSAIRQKMTDIVSPEAKEPKVNLFRKPFEKKPKRKSGRAEVKPSFAPRQRLAQNQAAKKAGPLSADTRGISARVAQGRSVASKWSRVLTVFVILVFITAVVIGWLVLPTTEITISPKTEKVKLDLSIIGSRNISQIDESLNKLPLQEIEVTKSKSREFQASGEKELNEKAQGILTVYNEYSSSPQGLVATTRFESPEGKIFRILENITVPGATIVENKIVPSSVEVEVIADQAGADYNIGPIDFTIPGFKGGPKFSGFYAKSNAPMTGGSTQKVKVVTKEDLEKAEEELREELKSEIKQSFDEQIPTDLKVIEDSLKEDITIVSTVKEDTQADKFTIEMKATMTALLFREDHLKQLVGANVVSNISTNKILLPETQQIKWLDWEIEENGEVVFSLYAEEEVVPYIDVDELKTDLAGRTEKEVRKYLAERSEIREAEVSFWPFWVKKIPSQKNRIKIVINSPSSEEHNK